MSPSTIWLISKCAALPRLVWLRAVRPSQASRQGVGWLSDGDTRTDRTDPVGHQIVGYRPGGSCNDRRRTVPRGTRSRPQRRHEPSHPTTRRASTERPGSGRRPFPSRPNSSTRRNRVTPRQERPKGHRRDLRVLPYGRCGSSHRQRLRPLPHRRHRGCRRGSSTGTTWIVERHSSPTQSTHIATDTLGQIRVAGRDSWECVRAHRICNSIVQNLRGRQQR